MKKTALTLAILLSSSMALADLTLPKVNWEVDCAPAEAPALTRSQFRWNMGLDEILLKEKEVRRSGLRLPERMYYDAQAKQFVIPYEQFRGGAVRVPYRFVQSVRLHVQEAVRLGYVDAVIFPDMGHSHLLLPEKDWNETYSKIPVQQQNKAYEAFFSNPKVKVLYHTAEQLKMHDENRQVLNNRHLQWRFFSRNLVGDLAAQGRLELYQNPTHSHNTVGEVPGYRWWGAGFQLSASDKGCLSYSHRGEIRRFDISLIDLAP